MKWLATLLIVTQLCSQAVSIAKNQEQPAAPAAAVATQSPAPTPEPTPEPTPAATPTPTETPAATPETKKETPKQESNTPQASAQHTTRKGISYTDEDVEELARIIFWEAGSESERGQMAVAEVILNRVQHDAWPDTIQGVIYQSSQFTPTEDPAYKTRPIDSIRLLRAFWKGKAFYAAKASRILAAANQIIWRIPLRSGAIGLGIISSVPNKPQSRPNWVCFF